MVVVLGGAAAAPAAVLAWSHPCTGNNDDPLAFAGMLELHDFTRGARAKMEFASPTLCTSPAAGEAAFSSLWVAVTGQDPNDFFGDNIFQVGIDKCENGAASGCAPGSTANVPYYFWAYGRMDSSACNEVAPLAVKAPLGNANTNTYWYAIRKSGADYGGRYIASIGGSDQATQGWFGLDACWDHNGVCCNGVDSSEYMNEVQDLFTQAGGSVGNPQTWSSVTWTDHSGAAHPISRAYSDPCDTVGLGWQQGGMRCFVLPNAHDGWNLWDSRQP
jgi:hypothetical protein